MNTLVAAGLDLEERGDVRADLLYLGLLPVLEVGLAGLLPCAVAITHVVLVRWLVWLLLRGR